MIQRRVRVVTDYKNRQKVCLVHYNLLYVAQFLTFHRQLDDKIFFIFFFPKLLFVAFSSPVMFFSDWVWALFSCLVSKTNCTCLSSSFCCSASCLDLDSSLSSSSAWILDLDSSLSSSSEHLLRFVSTSDLSARLVLFSSSMFSFSYEEK